MKTKRLNIFIDPELIKKAKITALKMGMTVSEFISGLIIGYTELLDGGDSHD